MCGGVPLLDAIGKDVSAPCFFLYLKLVETKTLPLPEFKFEMALEYL